MNDIVITITPYGSLILMGVLALALGWCIGYLKGTADTETRRRGELDRAQAQHAAATKDMREAAHETLDKLA